MTGRGYNEAVTSSVLVCLAAMLWGSDLLLRPGVLRAGWSPVWVVLGEHLLLTLAFAGALWRGRRALGRLTGRQWTALLCVAWGGSALATWLYTQAFTLGSPLTAILLQKTQPVFALLLAGWVLRERRAAWFWPWCVAALAGAWLLTGITTLPSVQDVGWRQAACALGAAALWGGATVAGRALSLTLPPSLLAGARFALALPVLALMAAFSRVPALTLSAGTGHAVLFLLLIVLLPDLAGMGLYYIGLRETPASLATLAELCYPLTSLLIGLGVLHAHITRGQWWGLALLLVAVLRLSRQPDVVRQEGKAYVAPAAVS